ncbi:MAG: metal-dependent hydrolase [Gemmatimonadetes bacterium]|nr:metal-dependent hydrolase [Gemmatimonadota bacterium]
MSYKGHLEGGLLVAAAVAAVAEGSGARPETTMGLFATALFFSLFPDLDTSSRPQRWFFKFVFAGLLYLAWAGEYRTATAVAVLALLPVLDHHRGWTHCRLSPLAAAVVAAAGYAWWKLEGAGPGEWVAVLRELPHGLEMQFAGAALAGWYTHLILDGLFRVFPQENEP